MIPTAVTNANTQTATTATLGIAALILEGRALAEDSFIISSTGKRHKLLFPPGHPNATIEGPNLQRINITSNPTANLPLPLYRLQQTSTNSSCSSSTAGTSSTKTSGSSSSDYEHFQRLRQKLSQLRQSSPSTSNHEPYSSMEYKIVVGSDDCGGNSNSSDLIEKDDDENNQLIGPARVRKLSGYYNNENSNSEINKSTSRPNADTSLLFSLQSLATTCLFNTPQHSNSILSSLDNLPESQDYWYNYGGPTTSSLSQLNKKKFTQDKIATDVPKTICSPPKQGPHCDQFLKKIGVFTTNQNTIDNEEHICDITNLNEICYHWQVHCRQIEVMLSRSDPICIEVYLGPEIHEILLEQWIIEELDTPTTPTMTIQALCNAVRSQMYFSQISAWSDLLKKLPKSDLQDNLRIRKIKTNSKGQSEVSMKQPHLDIIYRIKPYDSTASFNAKPIVHNFPNVQVSDNCAITVCLKSLPRLPGGIPKLNMIKGGCSIKNTLAAEAMIAKKVPSQSTSAMVNSTASNFDIMSQNSNINLCDSPQTNRDEKMMLDDRLITPCQEKGKHKCAYDDFDDEDYDLDEIDYSTNKNVEKSSNSNDLNEKTEEVSHRERQLMKYRKRMTKRDKKKKDSNEGTSNYSSLSNQSGRSEDFNDYHPDNSNNFQNESNLVQSNNFKEMSMNSTSNHIPPMYDIIRSIPESVQTLPIEMISIGTQTVDLAPILSPPQSYPNCNNCGNEMTLFCWNCNDCNNENQSQPIGKGELLLQSIQRTPKMKTNKSLLRNLKNNNNNTVGDGNSSMSNSDCQLCKRQKTQHNFQLSEELNNRFGMSSNSFNSAYGTKEHFSMAEINNISKTLNNNNNCCNNLNEISSSIDSPMQCACHKNVLMVELSDNDTIKTTTVFTNNNNNNYENFHKTNSKIVVEDTEIQDQFKTPNHHDLIKSPPNQQPKKSMNIELNVNCDRQKKLLPKINLTNIFCNNSKSKYSSSPIPIKSFSSNSDEAKQALEKFVFENGMTVDDEIVTPPEIPVQKSNSAPTLPPASPSALSPRFLKQGSTFYKRRSRHLSDRSDRSDEQQYSDEDFDSLLYSPATSPLKNKYFQRGLSLFGRKSLLGNLEESLLQRRITPKTQVSGFKVLLGASGGFCPAQLSIPAAAYFYELEGQTLSTPYMCEIRLSRKGYYIPRIGTVQATLLNPFGTVVRMFVVPYNFQDMPPMCQTFIRQRILAVDSSLEANNNSNKNQYNATKEQLRSLRYSIHLRFQTSRSGRLTLHTDIRFLISRRTDSDTAAAHAKGALELPNELKIITTIPDCPKYSARQDITTGSTTTQKI